MKDTSIAFGSQHKRASRPERPVPSLLLVVPDVLPAVAECSWLSSAAIVFEQVLRRVTAGSMLGLFRSKDALQRVERRLRALEYQVRTSPTGMHTYDNRGAGGQIRLLESLSEAPDLPPTCTCLVLDQLPFSAPDGSSMASHLTERPRWFTRSILVPAIATFRQLTAQLLQSGQSRCVLVVLDSRLVDAPYGRFFLQGLSVHTTRSTEHITPFLSPNDTKDGAGSGPSLGEKSSRALRTGRGRRRSALTDNRHEEE